MLWLPGPGRPGLGAWLDQCHRTGNRQAAWPAPARECDVPRCDAPHIRSFCPV